MTASVSTGGQPAGLLDIVRVSIEAARDYANGQFKKYQNKPLGREIPFFNQRFEFARDRALRGYMLRRQMPVLGDGDIAKIKAVLALKSTADLCEVCQMTAIELKVIQKEIYFDRAIDHLAENGVDASIAMTVSKHLFVAAGGEILDGNHRWLSVALSKPRTEMLVYKFGLDLGPLLKFLLEYSDSQGRLRNE